MNAHTKLSPRGNSLAVTIPREVLDVVGLKQGDELAITARNDKVIELRHVVPAEAVLEEAFEWSLGRYAQTYADLAK